MLLPKLLMVFALISIVNAQCDLKDRSIGDLCYSFPTTRSNFSDAQEYCHSLNQNLAVIHTHYQNNFLATMVSVGLGSSTGKFWIGLSRPSTGAPYKWDDGTPLTWSNFNGARDGLYVAENVANGQWQSLGGKEILSFVCSYDPSSTHPTLPPPTSLPKPRVTCLFMIDLQSLGIEQKAISTYQSYYNFALLVASKLNDAAEFTGFLDSFGYSSGLMNHDTYPINSYADLISAPFPIDGTDDDIDLDLKDVDASLTTAAWVPPTKDQTCLIFFSAAPAAEYGGTTIKTTYDSFTTIIGVLLGNGVNSIPGLIDSIGAYSMSDADAQTVVQKLLESLP